MAELILSGLWRAVWQSGILFVLVWLFVRATPKLSPAVHCWAWRVVCIKMLLALAVSTSINIPLLPANTVASETLAGSTGSATSDTSTNLGVSSSSEVSSGLANATLPSSETNVAAATSSPVENAWQWRTLLIPVLAMLWIGGVLFQLGRLVTDWLHARRLRSAAESIDHGEIQRVLRHEVIDDKMAHCPSLLSAETMQCPAVIGLTKPSILLPHGLADNASNAELRMMLRHELAHIRRRDLWWNWLAAITRALFFFNPLAWVTLREWMLSQESACDEMALKGQVDQSPRYAEMLMEIALTQNPARSPAYAAGAFESFETLKRRIEKMANFGTHSTFTARLVSAAAVFLISAGLLPWNIGRQQGLFTESAASAEPIDNSKARGRFGGVGIAVADVSNVSKIKHEIRNDFNRIRSKMQPTFTEFHEEQLWQRKRRRDSAHSRRRWWRRRNNSSN